MRMSIHRKGFTLIELLVVMGIMLILVSLAVPAVNTARNRAKDTEVKAGCNQIQAALEQYATDHTGFYPGAQWLKDAQDPPNWHVGPGVIGALPSFDSADNPRKDFTVSKTDLPGDGVEWRDPYLDDKTPNPQTLDALVVGGYLTDYPTNPFIAAAGGVKAQMSNMLYFNPIVGANGVPNPDDRNTLDWDRYSPNAVGATLRTSYSDFGRGMFSYIPFNPNNIVPVDFTTSLDLPAGSEYYKRCRSYMLVGWGSNRIDDGQAKGLSLKYWYVDPASGDGWFDFDHNMRRDLMETWLRDKTSTGLVGREMVDSSGGSNVGKFGDTLPGGAVDIDSAFFGATYLYITGS
jgi:prepilin-type N-terminal cleavage/methylation domain-containing protein